MADILNIGDYSARSPLSFLGSRWFRHICVYLWNFSVVIGTPMGFPDQGSIRFEPSRCIKHYVNSKAKWSLSLWANEWRIQLRKLYAKWKIRFLIHMGILWVLLKIKFMPHISILNSSMKWNKCKSALASLRSIISITYNLYGMVSMCSMSKFLIHGYFL